MRLKQALVSRVTRYQSYVAGYLTKIASFGTDIQYRLDKRMANFMHGGGRSWEDGDRFRAIGIHDPIQRRYFCNRVSRK